MTAVQLLAATSTGLFVASVMWSVVRPKRRLAGRVRPYALSALTALGRPVDARSVRIAAGEAAPGRTGIGGLLERTVEVLLLRGDADETLHRRLVQAKVYAVPEERLVSEHRIRQVLAGVVGASAAGAAGAAVGLSGAGTVALGLIGLVAGAARPSGAVDRAITRRRERMRAELPPVAQLLAMRARAGGSVTTALAATADRCHGLVADDLGDALSQHRAGRPLEEALETLASTTPEPEAARLYRLLAGAMRYGLDAAPELLRLAREGREHHLTRLRRDATKRRAALLLPVIGLLAPLMLLFVAAPLPSLLGG
ncbi:Type II/IV secretion system protein TadC, associated with Flp pilus assembly [Euzebya pacifica]|uniref:Type II/IV secretion system protein TadC, associated with Flp pilus assembly n=1 Tax=Euzebya pacifica TaxID=1608957 RepID=A0A346Y505_9ACTN|nr:type II secretion system F family protein [Euzebya pacifica]AXV09552.1 Type II/IV secretion system protein TadC, associated with Flp pilus assembly [Euzebya pacifica]